MVDGKSRAVAVWRTEWLPPSETFIRDHVGHLQSWRGLRMARQTTDPRLEEPDLLPRRYEHLRRVKGGERIRTPLQNRHLVRLLRASDAALVHAHFGTDATGVLPVARAVGLPLIVTLHGYDVTSMPLRPVIGAKYLQALPELFDYAARLLAVSEHIRQRAIGLGAPPEKVVVHHTGIPLDSSPAPDAVNRSGIAFVGRLVEKKGLEYLLQAVARLPSRHREVEVTIVGDGPLREQLESEATRLGVNASFLRHVSAPEVRDLLSRNAIAAVPSVTASNGDTEGLPTVVLEASCRGATVIATRHAGTPEVIEHRVSGLLVPEADVPALTRGLTDLLDDPELRVRLAASAANMVAADFDLRLQTRRLEKIYDDVVGADLD